MDYESKVKAFEIEIVNEALKRTNGNQSAAARLLQISERHLRSRLERLGLKKHTIINMKNKTDFLQFVSNPQNVKRILVIRNGLLGDITFITSALNRLSNTFFDSEIDVITGPISTPLLENFPHIRNIIPFNYNLSFFSVVKQIFFFFKITAA